MPSRPVRRLIAIAITALATLGTRPAGAQQAGTPAFGGARFGLELTATSELRGLGLIMMSGARTAVVVEARAALDRSESDIDTDGSVGTFRNNEHELDLRVGLRRYKELRGQVRSSIGAGLLVGHGSTERSLTSVDFFTWEEEFKGPRFGAFAEIGLAYAPDDRLLLGMRWSPQLAISRLTYELVDNSEPTRTEQTLRSTSLSTDVVSLTATLFF